MTDEIREAEAMTRRATVLDVMEAIDATLPDLADVAHATGISIDAMCSTAFGSIGANQLRSMCLTLRRSPDELLAIAEAPEVELARRKAIARASHDLRDAAMVLADRVRGAVHLMRQMCDGDGIGTERAAALDLLADSLDDAAESVTQASDALTECIAS